jgi:gluconolactonase
MTSHLTFVREERCVTATMLKAHVIEVAAVPAHEGPVWCPDEKTLYYTTVPVPRAGEAPLVRIDAVRLDLAVRDLAGPVAADRVWTVVSDANAANGMCAAADGGLLVCEQGSRDESPRIARLDPATGERTTVVAGYLGQQLNSPNDVARHPDGSIWFTDPSYGWYQGFRPRPRIADAVHRFDPATGRHSIVSYAFDKPNGLAIAPDGRTVYVGDSGANHEPGSFEVTRPHTVAALSVDGDRITGVQWTHTVPAGYPDGLRTDRAGRVWFTTGDGLRVLAPGGEHLGDIPLPGAVNFTFAGDEVLLVTADVAIWAVVLERPDPLD